MGRKALLTPEAIAKARNVHEQRLMTLFEILMHDCEAMQDVANFAAVEKRAKALSAVRRTLRDIYQPNPDSGEMGMHDDDSDIADTLDAWKLRLERKLDRLAGAGTAQGVDRPARSEDDKVDHE